MEPDGTVVVEMGSMMPEIEMAYDIVESNLPKKTLVVLDSVEALSENYGVPVQPDRQRLAEGPGGKSGN